MLTESADRLAVTNAGMAMVWAAAVSSDFCGVTCRTLASSSLVIALMTPLRAMACRHLEMANLWG